MDEKRLDEVGNRLLAVCEKRRLKKPVVGWVESELGIQVRVGTDYFSPADLRALANAIDTEDEATAAAIHDLKEESAAYQQGLKDGRRQGKNELFDGCLVASRKLTGPVFRELIGPTAELRREGESILVRAVETPAEQVRKERERMQLINDLQWLASRVTRELFAPSEMMMVVFRAVMPKAREAILEYERDRTERLSGPDGR